MTRRSADAITHRIGVTGSLVLRTVSGTVRVRGVEGDEAKVLAHLDINRDEDAADSLEVTRQEGELRVEVRGRRQRGLAGLLSSVARGHIDVEIPHGAALRLTGVSAELEADGIHGDQEYKTVSGDLTISNGSGAIKLSTISGDVHLAATAVELEASTTSGDIAVEAQQLTAVHVRSLSGDVRLAGRMAPGSTHRIESVSGDLQLVPAAGLRLQVSGFSSDVDSELPYREESRGGRRVLVIGDGGAEVSFRTMSGDASVLAGRFDTAKQPPVAPAADRRLEILRAVERGEIDVNEATRLLEEAGDD